MGEDELGLDFVLIYQEAFNKTRVILTECLLMLIVTAAA